MKTLPAPAPFKGSHNHECIERLSRLERGVQFRIAYKQPVGGEVYVKKDHYEETEDCLVMNVYTGQYRFAPLMTPVVRTHL